MPKLYFNFFISDNCRTLKYWKRYIKEQKINKLELVEAERDRSSSHFYCKHFEDVCVKNEGTCGKNCDYYSPRNGKSGICKHNGYLYSDTDKKITIKHEKVK